MGLQRLINSSTSTGHIFLAKDSNDKYWRLIFIQVCNWDRSEDKFMKSNYNIYIDGNQSIVNITLKNKNDEKICDACGYFLEDLDVQDYICGNGCTVKYYVMIYYYYMWYAQKRTSNELNKFKHSFFVNKMVDSIMKEY